MSRYQIGAQLGQGGTGRVFEAVDSTRGRGVLVAALSGVLLTSAVLALVTMSSGSDDARVEQALPPEPTAAHRAEPGERTPIKVLLKPYPDGWMRYEHKLTLRAPFIKAKRLARLAVVAKQLAKRPIGTSLEALITVRNDEPKPVQFIEATVVLYDEQDRPIEISSGFVEDKPLAAGAQGQAQVLLLPKSDTPPRRWQVFLDATVYPAE